MKKILLIIAIVLFFIPIITYADIDAEYHTSIFDNNGDVGYVVRYSTTFGSLDEGTNISYIKFDPNILQYSSVKEYESNTGAKIDVVSLEPGVIELTITSIFNEYDGNFLLVFKFKEQKVASKIELIPAHEYKNLQCEDCNGAWMGNISAENKTRIIEFSRDGTIVKSGDDANIIINDESEDFIIEQSKEETYKVKDKVNYIAVIYVLSGIIFVLLIALIYFVRKSKNIKK